MSKRFDIKLGLEELLEVDKVTEEVETKEDAPDSEKVLDKAVTAAEEPVAEDAPADTEEKTDEASDTPVEVPEDKTTLDGSEPTEDKEKEETGNEDKTEEIEEVKEEIKEDSDEGDELTETASMSDVADDIKEDENNDAEVADANDAVATLESIAEELETSLDTGGLSPAAAEITDIAVRSICSRVGIAPTEQEVISIEGFKTASSRIRNTNLAIENIKGYLLTLWQAFVASIKRGIEWIKKFMASVFNDYHKLKKDIKNLKEAATKIEGTNIQVGQLKFEKESIINLLKISSGPQDVSDNIEKLSTFTKNYFDLVETQRTTIIKNIETIVSNLSKDGIVPTVVLLTRLNNAFITKGNLAGYSPLKETVECYYSAQTLPGNQNFLAYYPSEKIDLSDKTKFKMFDDALKDSKFSFEINQIENKKPVLDLPILPKADILILLNKLDGLCDEALSSQKIFDKFVKEKSTIQRSLEELIKHQNDTSKVGGVFNKIGELAGREQTEKFDGNSAYTSISSRMTMLKNTYENGSTKLSALILKTIKASLAYTTDCINENLNAEKKKSSNILSFWNQSLDNKDTILYINNERILDNDPEYDEKVELIKRDHLIQKGKKIFDKEGTVLYYLNNEFSLSTYTGVDNAGRNSASIVFGFYNKSNPIETNRILSAFITCVNRLFRDFDSEKERRFTDENKLLCKEALEKLRKAL